jgi:malate dehydrogenase
MANPKITIVGAGQVGATAAFLLVHKGVADVVLLDVAEGLPQGKALDIMHSRSIERFDARVSGSNDYADTEGSDVVVVTAGLPRRPGMTRADLLEANSSIVRDVVPAAIEASPDTILLMVTNPLDVMTYLAWTVSGLPHERVLGMGGVLDGARFAYFVSEATGASVDRVDALVMGSHGDRMVPVPSKTTVDGTPLLDLLPPERVDELVERTVYGGAEVVSLLKTGSAFYAPGASVAAMVRAMLGDAPATMSSCVLLEGAYGLSDLYLSVPATIGRSGVIEVPEVDLTASEREALEESAASVASVLDELGLRGS